jgi:hypothetical protein
MLAFQHVLAHGLWRVAETARAPVQGTRNATFRSQDTGMVMGAAEIAIFGLAITVPCRAQIARAQENQGFGPPGLGRQNVNRVFGDFRY